MKHQYLICSCAAGSHCEFLAKAERNPGGWRGPDGIIHRAEPAWFHVRPGRTSFCCYPADPCPLHAKEAAHA